MKGNSTTSPEKKIDVEFIPEVCGQNTNRLRCVCIVSIGKNNRQNENTEFTTEEGNCQIDPAGHVFLQP